MENSCSISTVSSSPPNSSTWDKRLTCYCCLSDAPYPHAQPLHLIPKGLAAPWELRCFRHLLFSVLVLPSFFTRSIILNRLFFLDMEWFYQVALTGQPITWREVSRWRPEGKIQGCLSWRRGTAGVTPEDSCCCWCRFHWRSSKESSR